MSTTEVTRDRLVEALTEFYLSVRNYRGYQESGQIAHPDEVAGALHATLSRIAAERGDTTEPTAVTLQERLISSGYSQKHAPDATHYELGDSAGLRVACFNDGFVRVSMFDSQMTCKFTVEFDCGVDDDIILAVVSEAEKKAGLAS